MPLALAPQCSWDSCRRTRRPRRSCWDRPGTAVQSRSRSMCFYSGFLGKGERFHSLATGGFGDRFYHRSRRSISVVHLALAVEILGSISGEKGTAPPGGPALFVTAARALHGHASRSHFCRFLCLFSPYPVLEAISDTDVELSLCGAGSCERGYPVSQISVSMPGKITEAGDPSNAGARSARDHRTMGSLIHSPVVRRRTPSGGTGSTPARTSLGMRTDVQFSRPTATWRGLGAALLLRASHGPRCAGKAGRSASVTAPRTQTCHPESPSAQ